MRTANPYPRGADLSIYPTVAVMREAYLFGFYRTYPHEAHVRLGPLPMMPAGASESAGAVYAEARPRAHAVIILPRKTVLLCFARRATRRDLEHLERERELLRATPELAPVLHWRTEMRLVHCDIADGVEEARARGIGLSLYQPRWLATHRPRNVNSPEHGLCSASSARNGSRLTRRRTTGQFQRIADPAERTHISTASLPRSPLSNARRVTRKPTAHAERA